MALFSRRYLIETIDPHYGYIQLLICCYTTGLLDSASVNNWGVFVGNQTGNTVFLALSTASLPETQRYAYATTLLAIGSFLLGAYFTALVSHQINSHSRIFITLTFLAQAALIILAAALAMAGLVPEDPHGTGRNLNNIRILTAIAPLAFQFGMQIATSRILGFSELPTNVLTSAYADVVGDPKLFALAWNPKRDRRVASIVLVLGGGISGAWMMRKGQDVYVLLWIAAGVKILVGLSVWLFMSAKAGAEGLIGASKEQRV